MKKIIKLLAILTAVSSFMSCNNMNLEEEKEFVVSEERINYINERYFSENTTRSVDGFYVFGKTTWYSDGTIKVDVFHDEIMEYLEDTGSDVPESVFVDITIIHELCHAYLPNNEENRNHGKAWVDFMTEKTTNYIKDNGLSLDLVEEFLYYTF